MRCATVHTTTAILLTIMVLFVLSGCETMRAHQAGDLEFNEFFQMAKLDTNYPTENAVGFTSLRQADNWLRENLW